MKILITGSTGFVGSNWLQYCKKNSLKYSHKIFSRKELSGSDEVYGEYFTDIDAVLHLAGKAHDLKNVSSPNEYYQVNTELTKRVFDNFLKSKASIFIFISSIKAVVDKYDGILTEEIFPHPVTDYGKSKLFAENYIFSKNIPSEKHVYILRPCMIHGPGNKGNLNLLYKVVSKGLPYPLASFNNVRSYLSVENLCFTIFQLLTNSNVASGIYHISDDEPISTIDVVEIIAKSINKKARLLRIRPSIIKWIAKVGDIIHLPLNSERLQKLTDSYIVSNRKLLTALSVPLPVNARDGLIKTIESFNNAS